MPAMYEVTFVPEGRTVQFAGSRGNHYDLPDGSGIDLLSAPVWCRHCHDLSHGEWMPTLEEIDRELADLGDPKSDAYKSVARGALHELAGGGDELLSKYVATVRQRRQWREGRSSPPKCIECGSADIEFLKCDGDIPHPEMAGSIHLECVGLCSTSFNGWFFTPEGERVLREPTLADGYHIAPPPTPMEIDREAADRDAVDRFLATANIHPASRPQPSRSLAEKIRRWLRQA